MMRVGIVAALAMLGALGSVADGRLLAATTSQPTVELVDAKGRFGTAEVAFGPGKGINARIPLKPEWGVLRIRTQMMTKGLAVGAQSWQNGRMPMSFHGPDGKMVGGWPNVFGFSGDTPWTDCDRLFPVPRGATELRISESHLGVAGTVAFKPISITVARNRLLKPENMPVPEGVEGDPESLESSEARRLGYEPSATRARYCLNGLWRARPAVKGERTDAVPGANDAWGWGKIPAAWKARWNPRTCGQEFLISNWWEDDGRPIEPELQDEWWYRRSFVMPAEAAGRRVALTFDLIATHADVYVDGAKAGEIAFPGGEVDITDAAKPGRHQTVALYVTAYPQNAESLRFNAPDRADKVKNEVKFRGVTGDLWLDLAPKAARFAETWAETSVERGEITFKARVEGAAAGEAFALKATASGCGETREFAGKATVGADGVVALTVPWPDAKLWDTHTPGNVYAARLTLRRADAPERAVDESLPFKVAFREVKIRGRDVYLNGRRIHLRALTCATMVNGADLAAKAGATEACRRFLDFGFNFVIADNYDFKPGAVNYMEGTLDACDETGMLYSFTMPHLTDFGGHRFADDPQNAARYRALAKWAVSKVRNHPSVISFAINHNCVGYTGDMDPLRLDGTYDPAPEGKVPPHDWLYLRRKAADRLRDILRGLDPTRMIYNHESGSLADFHTVNIYLNWAPVEERSEWLHDWAARGTRPMFFVEWGCPHISSWSSYRGPLFIWRNNACHSLWAQEYAAAFRGDAAYEASENVRNALATEERLWARGEPFHWGALLGDLRQWQSNYQDIQGLFLDENWRSHRAWGVTAMLPWDGEALVQRVGGKAAASGPVRDRFRDLKTPGPVADVSVPGRGYFYDRGPRADFERTGYGRAFDRWNRAACAFIGGDGVFTDKRHLYAVGETVKKTLVILNDYREEKTVRWRWALSDAAGKAIAEKAGETAVEAGGRADVAVATTLPKAGGYRLEAAFAYVGARRAGYGDVGARRAGNGDDVVAKVEDRFGLTALEPKPAVSPKGLLLYDPKGLTAANFRRLGIAYTPVEELSPNTVSNGQLLVIGRESLTLETYNRAVRYPNRNQWTWWTGRVLVFEQREDVLNAIGFRTQVYGLRQAFPRFRDKRYPSLADSKNLRNWAGEATLVAPYLDGIDELERAYTRKPWSGYLATRVWRCRNRGNVASVLLEKPATGDWRALCDGAFDLEYSPLLQLVTSGGSVTFCQLDVTGRTTADPAADAIVKELVAGLGVQTKGIWKAQCLGLRAFVNARDAEVDFNHDVKQDQRDRFLAASGAKKPKDLDEKVKRGATVVCLGFTAAEVAAWSPVKLACVDTNGCYYSRIEKLPPELNGLSNADWAWHGAMDFAAFTEPAEDGNSAFRVVRHGKGRYVFWQVPPWMVDCEARPYLRPTRRKANAMFARLLGNLGFRFNAVAPHYLDAPVAEDDPYRYYRW